MLDKVSPMVTASNLFSVCTQALLTLPLAPTEPDAPSVQPEITQAIAVM